MLQHNVSIPRDVLMKKVPSIFAAERAQARTSNKYVFIPTIQLLDKLADHGWLPASASEVSVRADDRRGFQKHMIRFRRFDDAKPMTVGDSVAEMVLVNSHDGSSCYQLSAGLFRLVCSNGLIVPSSLFDSIRVKHTGNTNDVIEASYRIIESVPAIRDHVESMRAIELTKTEKTVFAESALDLKYEHGHSPVDPSVLLFPWRMSDDRNDLWTTFNTIQENMIEKGGLRGVNANTGRRSRTRAIRGIDENVKLNKALWTLAEGMRAIKEGKAA